MNRRNIARPIRGARLTIKDGEPAIKAIMPDGKVLTKRITFGQMIQFMEARELTRRMRVL